MDWTAWLVVLAIVGMSGFLVRHVGINLSATSVLFGTIYAYIFGLFIVIWNIM